jgi:hypothetical protein
MPFWSPEPEAVHLDICHVADVVRLGYRAASAEMAFVVPNAAPGR